MPLSLLNYKETPAKAAFLYSLLSQGIKYSRPKLHSQWPCCSTLLSPSTSAATTAATTASSTTTIPASTLVVASASVAAVLLTLLLVLHKVYYLIWNAEVLDLFVC